MYPIDLYTLSLHDALPICAEGVGAAELRVQGESRSHSLRHPCVEQPDAAGCAGAHATGLSHERRHIQPRRVARRSEEHTSELQSHSDLVCRLLLEKKKRNT